MIDHGVKEQTLQTSDLEIKETRNVGSNRFATPEII